jgi:hypothetical protein
VKGRKERPKKKEHKGEEQGYEMGSLERKSGRKTDRGKKEMGHS